MRHDGEREGDRLAAGLLAKQRRIEARLTEIERRLGSLEGAETSRRSDRSTGRPRGWQ